MSSSNPGRQDAGSPPRSLGRSFASSDPERQRETVVQPARSAEPRGPGRAPVRHATAGRAGTGWVGTQPENDAWYEGGSGRRSR